MEISFIDRDGKPQSFIFPFNAMETDYALTYYGENELKRTLESADRTIVNSYMEQHFITPVKLRSAFLQKHLDKTAEQVKSELRQEFLEKRKNEEAHINKYTDLYTDIKTFNSVLQKEYEDCQTQIEELTDIVYDFQKNLDKTAEQVKEELRQEFLPKNEDEEAHVTIYNDLYTDIKTVDSIYKEKYEQCQKQIAELINTLSIHQKKIEILGAPQPMDWFESFVNVINLLATYIIAFQMIYILYTFPENTMHPIVQYTKKILYKPYPIILGYLE